MKHRLPWTAILLLLLVSSLLAAAQTFKGKVVSIVDGDTVDVYHQEGQKPTRVRLDGIDCPEKAQDFGTKAKAKAGELVHEKMVTVEVKGHDRYGRVIGIVYYQDPGNQTRCLNADLVQLGFAWWYREYAPKNKTLENLELEAKNAKRGLWSQANPIPPWDFRKGIRKKEAPPVEGDPIVYITKTGKCYHREDCPHLRRSKIPIPLSKAKARGYKPCEECRPPG